MEVIISISMTVQEIRLKETDIYGNKTVYTYDALGNVLTETDVFGKNQ